MCGIAGILGVGDGCADRERLARNPQLRARLGRAGQRHVIEHYTWKAHVVRILARLAGGVETAGASR